MSSFEDIVAMSLNDDIFHLSPFADSARLTSSDDIFGVTVDACTHNPLDPAQPAIDLDGVTARARGARDDQ